MNGGTSGLLVAWSLVRLPCTYLPEGLGLGGQWHQRSGLVTAWGTPGPPFTS